MQSNCPNNVKKISLTAADSQTKSSWNLASTFISSLDVPHYTRRDLGILMWACVCLCVNVCGVLVEAHSFGFGSGHSRKSIHCVYRVCMRRIASRLFQRTHARIVTRDPASHQIVCENQITARIYCCFYYTTTLGENLACTHAKCKQARR